MTCNCQFLQKMTCNCQFLQNMTCNCHLLQNMTCNCPYSLAKFLTCNCHPTVPCKTFWHRVAMQTNLWHRVAHPHFFIMLHTHVIVSSVVRTIVVLTSNVFLLFRHHGTASINGSSNGVGTKLGDGIVSKVLPEYVEQMGIFLAQIFPTGLDRHPL